MQKKKHNLYIYNELDCFIVATKNINVSDNRGIDLLKVDTMKEALAYIEKEGYNPIILIKK